MIGLKQPLRKVGCGRKEEGRRKLGNGGLSLIYNPTLNHVEQMPFLVRHYTFAEPCWRLWGRAESCFLCGNMREWSALPVFLPPSTRVSPPGRQKVTCLPLSYLISSQHVRTRLPGYMHPHLLYQKRVNYLACLCPPLLLTLPPPWVDVPGTSEDAIEGATKVALLFTGHELLLGFRELNSWQNMGKSTESNSWKIKLTGAKSQFTLKNALHRVSNI